MKRIAISVIATVLLFTGACSDAPRMESEEEAAFNDSIADCIYRNGNPRVGTKEYRAAEEKCLSRAESGR